MLDVAGKMQSCSRQTYVTEDEITEVSLDSWAHCHTCDTFISATVLDTEQGEGAILFVRTGYVIKQIGQSSALPGAVNTLVVTLEVNVLLMGGLGVSTLVTISGLDGASPDGNPDDVALFQTETNSRWTGAKAQWNAAANEMVLLCLCMSSLVASARRVRLAAQVCSLTRVCGWQVIRLQEPATQRNANYLLSYYLPTFQFRMVNTVRAQEPPQQFVQVTDTLGEEVLNLLPMTTPPKPKTVLFIKKVFTRADGGQSQGVSEMPAMPFCSISRQMPRGRLP